MSNQDPEVRLQQLEARLRNAIRSRDAYLTTLAQDQRLEMPSKFQRRTRSMAPHNRRRRGSNRRNQKQHFQVFHSESRERGTNLAAPKDNLEEDFADPSTTVRPPPLLSRLETSALFWGTQRQFGQNGQNDLSALDPLRPLGARIPENYGILLDSDVPSMDEQLAQIRQSLAQLKQFRLSGPTSDYFRSVRPQSSHNPRPSAEAPIGISRVLPSPSMVQIRTRLLNLEWHIEGRVRELLDEHRKPMKTEPRGTVSWQSDFGKESWHPNAPSESHLAQNQQKEMAQRVPGLVPYQQHQATVPKQSSMFPAEILRHEQPMMRDQEQQAPTQQMFQDPIVRSTAQIAPQKDTVEPSATFEFEPMRQIVFGTTMETAKFEEGNQQKAELEPKAETTLAEPAEPVVPPKREDDDVNFQRMLDVLKNPRKFDLSSSTSSSPSSPEPPVNKVIDAKVTTPPRHIGDQFNFGGGIRSTQMYAATTKDKEGDSDSSDSFFK